MTPLPGKLIAANSSPNDSSNLITGAHPTSSQTTLLPSITGPTIDTASPNASTNLIAQKLSDCPTIGTTASNTSTNIVTSDLLASSQSTLLPTALYPQTVAVSLSSKGQHACLPAYFCYLGLLKHWLQHVFLLQLLHQQQ